MLDTVSITASPGSCNLCHTLQCTYMYYRGHILAKHDYFPKMLVTITSKVKSNEILNKT